MTKKTATITTVLAAIGLGLAVLAIPATAQEPTTAGSEYAVCVDHDEATMRHDATEEWMGELDWEMTTADHAEIHDHMHDMMAMMHGDGAHEMDEASMPGSRSMGSSRSMDAGALTGGSSTRGGMMMGAGS